MGGGNGKGGNGKPTPQSTGGKQNLTAPQWKPGQSGNPGGRPKGPSPTDLMIKMLRLSPKRRAALARKLGKPIPSLTDIVIAFLSVCEKGEVKAIRELLQRLDGKVPDQVNLVDMRSQAQRIAEQYEGVTAEELIEEAERLVAR